MPQKAISEILEEASKPHTRKERADVLKKYSCGPLKDVLGYALNPSVSWLLPKSDPPYKEMSKGSDAEGMLYSQTKMFQYFVAWDGKPAHPNMTQLKREQLFVNVLECIDPRDAKLVLMIKNKQLPKGITLSVVKEAFPKMTEGWKD